MIKSIVGSILFLCLCFAVFFGINRLGVGFLSWFSHLELFKQIVVFMMLGSFIWMLIRALKDLLVGVSAKLAVPVLFALMAIFIASLINALTLIYSSWMITGSYTGKQSIPSFFFLILTLEIAIAPINDLPRLLGRTLSEMEHIDQQEVI